jgi:hypothetical protein
LESTQSAPPVALTLESNQSAPPVANLGHTLDSPAERSGTTESAPQSAQEVTEETSLSLAGSLTLESTQSAPPVALTLESTQSAPPVALTLESNQSAPPVANLGHTLDSSAERSGTTESAPQSASQEDVESLDLQAHEEPQLTAKERKTISKYLGLQ